MGFVDVGLVMFERVIVMVVNADKDDGKHVDWNCRNKGEIIVIMHV